MNCKGIFDNFDWFVPEEYWDSFLEYFKTELEIIDYSLKDDVICNNYGTFFKGSKTQIWNWIISHNLHSLDETVFIDDVLTYLKYAEEKGVTAYHISSFID